MNSILLRKFNFYICFGVILCGGIVLLASNFLFGSSSPNRESSVSSAPSPAFREDNNLVTTIHNFQGILGFFLYSSAVKLSDSILTFPIHQTFLVATKPLYHTYALFSPILIQVHVMKKGETLDKIFRNYGVSPELTSLFITEIRKFIQPAKLSISQKMSFLFRPRTDLGASSYYLQGFMIENQLLESIEVWQDSSNQILSRRIIQKTHETQRYFHGTVNSSIAETAQKQNIPYAIVDQLIQAFSHEIDFQRDIYPNTTFEIIYSVYIDENKRFIKAGKLEYAALQITPSQKKLEIFFFKNVAAPGFYHRDGSSIRRFLLRTPLDGARISSGYGMRHHPVLGYSRMHKGVDFAAATGTPIYAAGDGKIILQEFHKGYGNLIRVQHNQTYITVYAHLSRFANKLKAGQLVKQGQIIGYVGSTGLATGPHLHFEVLQNGRQVNPSKLKFDQQEKLSGQVLLEFLARVKEIEQKQSQLQSPTPVAEIQNSGSPQ